MYTQVLSMVSRDVDLTLLSYRFNLKKDQHVSAFIQLLTNILQVLSSGSFLQSLE